MATALDDIMLCCGASPMLQELHKLLSLPSL
jgi:hypothetical protein